MRSPLYRLFNYINISILPNINIYVVNKDTINICDYTILIFKEYYIKTYIWFYKYKNMYYSVVKLINNTYMYIYGYNKSYDTKYNFYISSDKDYLLRCMKPYIRNWYLEDITNTLD
jgi:hypothetical protein